MKFVNILYNFSYPLIYIPLPGNIPVEYVTPTRNYRPPPQSVIRRDKSYENTDVTSIPRWVRIRGAIFF